MTATTAKERALEALERAGKILSEMRELTVLDRALVHTCVETATAEVSTIQEQPRKVRKSRARSNKAREVVTE